MEQIKLITIIVDDFNRDLILEALKQAADHAAAVGNLQASDNYLQCHADIIESYNYNN